MFIYISFFYFTVLIGLCLILGIMDGCFVCLLGPIAFDIVGAHNASQAMGFLLAMISIPLMMGPMIGGKRLLFSVQVVEGIKYGLR